LTLPVKGRAADHTPVASAVNAKCAHWLIHSAQSESQRSRLHPAEDATFPAGTDPEVSLVSEGPALTGFSQSVPWVLLLDGRILLRPQGRAGAWRSANV
jgi:hypothetical protein